MLVLATLLSALLADPAQAPQESWGFFLPGNQHKWSRLPSDAYIYPPGARYAELNSVQRQGLYWWPAGSGIDLQTREGGWTGFLLSGIMTLLADGLDAPVTLSRLERFDIPEGVRHKLTCRPEDHCILYAGWADPHNRVAAWVPTAETDPSGPGPTFLDLQSQLRSSKFVSRGRKPVSVSTAFPWGIGFASLIRYPAGTTPESTSEYWNAGLVVEGTIRVEIDGVWSDPLGAGSYFATSRDSRIRISCQGPQCLIVGRRYGGDNVREGR